MPNYKKEWLVSDLLAGITVGLTVIPQAIAYANVAGLPLQVSPYYTRSTIDESTTIHSFFQYGLYSSFMACFVYTIFGSCKDVPVGPTAIAAILTREALQGVDSSPIFAVTLTFISGCICLLMGVLQLGDYITIPIMIR